MLKGQFYLATGFVGATMAVVALRHLVMAQQSRLTTPELILAAVVGIVVAVFAWYRANQVLKLIADDSPTPSDKVLVERPVPALLGSYSRG